MNADKCPACGELSAGERVHFFGQVVERQCSKHFWFVGPLEPYALRGVIYKALRFLAEVSSPYQRST